ncbi:solute carrier family 26 member prestin isoform X1 [Rhodnius prolixus]|uniref:solute carrier family 26 member prestin isoform X1 n=1 Tax=Rhodnius prolixus TaxID=13249 RepID=UPI003D18CF7D
MEEAEEPKRHCMNNKCTSWVINQIKKRLPIVVWFPKYQWKEHVGADLIAGVTLMFVNVPQGLAFSVLANVDLIYGLYTSCLASLLYCFMGTVPVSSFGPVAVGSMLTGEVVATVNNPNYTTNEIAVAVTFLIGVWYLIGFIVRLGVLSMIFRKPFVSGFITACACHILSKSVKLVFGIKSGNKYGMFSFFLNIYALYQKFDRINYPTVIISIVVIFILILNICVVRPVVAKFTKLVLPMEAIIMSISILVSYYCSFEEKGVPVVGKVPSGFPSIIVPDINLIQEVWAMSLVVALVNYSTTIAMVSLFNNEVDSDQELFAMGVANLVCSNFQCIVIGNSMMRTVISVSLGVKSLLATIISSLLLVFVLLFPMSVHIPTANKKMKTEMLSLMNLRAGPLFHSLPICVLGCIILTAASQLLIQRLKEIRSIWRKSLEDGFIWASAFAAGLILDLDKGMVVGALFSIRQILIEKQTAEVMEQRALKEQTALEQGLLEPEKANLLDERKRDDKNV